MVFVDLCAATMRNWHFRDAWLRTIARGCEIAQHDAHVARTVGACFGGLEINPYSVIGEIWQQTFTELLSLLPRGLLSLLQVEPAPVYAAAGDWLSWQAGWWESITDDPIWHARWQADLQTKWLHAISVMYKSNSDPRAQGLV